MEINLDKTKVYDLSDLTSGELNKVAEYADFNPVILDKFNSKYLIYEGYFWTLYFNISASYVVTNAKELFYTLENIQVDCRELSEEQIKEMADVFEKSGYKVGGLGMSKEVRFLLVEDGICFIGNSRDKRTITYSKFMELFGDKLPPYKEAPLKWNYDTLVGDVMETTDCVTPISSREKELKKTLKYLLKKDIILTPKQYKKLWKGL